MLYRKILVAFDGSPGSWKALRKAILLARDQGARLVALSVVEHLPRFAATVGEVEEEKEQQSAYFAKLQTEAVALAREQGVELEAQTAFGHAAHHIVRFAQSLGCDLVVLGQVGHSGGWNVLLGSTADRVVDQAACDVLVVRAVEAVQPDQTARGSVEDIEARLRVREVMTRTVTSVRPDMPLREAVEVLVSRNHRVVPVVDEGNHLVGILTNGDLVERGGLRLRVELLRTLSPELLAGELKALEEGRTVADVMTREVVSISPEATLDEAAHLMVARHLKRLPVVDSKGVLLGMVSRLDLLRTRSEARSQPVAEPPATQGKTIGEVMRTDVPTIRQGAPLAEILDAVVSTRLNRALVVDEAGRVVGIVTDAELVRRLSPRDHPSLGQVLMSRLPFAALSLEQRRDLERAVGMTARQLMLPNVPTVSPETPIADAIATMLREQRKLLPVVDQAERLLGAADRADLLRFLVRSEEGPKA